MAGQPWAEGARPLVFAHRGGAGLAPENTMAAFDRAVREGVDGIELDLRLSRDGEVVACHDATLDRTTDASGRVSRYTARELAGVDAGYGFTDGAAGRPFRGQGLGLPLFRDVLARFPRHALIAEMKDDEVELARSAVRLIRDAGAVERTCLGSFRQSVLDEARGLEPGLATGASRREVRRALYRTWLRLPLRSPAYRALQVPERREGHLIVTPRFIRAAHAARVEVQVWIVDEPEAMRRLIGWGVDALITDRPDVAVAVVSP